MTKREFAAFASRLMAIYSFLLAIGELHAVMAPLQKYLFPAYPGFLAGSSAGVVVTPATIAMVALPGLFYLIACFALWTGADVFGSLFIKHDEEASTMTIAGRDLMRAGFSLMGLWCIVHGAPRLIEYCCAVFLDDGSNPYQYARMFEHPVFGEAIGAAVELLLGVMLLFRANVLIFLIDGRSARH